MFPLSQFYESIFGAKTYKLSLDAGCTCPNRDGRKGWGGCIFCSESGSGDFAAGRNLSIKEQVEQAKKRVEAKVKGRSGNRRGKYIAYFQNFTSTYGDAKSLVQKYREALDCEDVEGLAIATRPDCLSEEILSKIAAISKNHFVQIELGLQTSNEATGRLINRCYSNEDYSDAVRRIRAANPNIHIVTHLIFGLPGESEADMMESVRFVVRENLLNSSQRAQSSRRDVVLLKSVDKDKTLCELQSSVRNFSQRSQSSQRDVGLVKSVVNTKDYKICENLCESVDKDKTLCELQSSVRNFSQRSQRDVVLLKSVDKDKTLCGLQGSVRNFSDFFGIKITSLYVVRGTKLAELYECGEYTPLQKEEYFSLLKKALSLLAENCIIHRLTGDPPKKLLLAPAWTGDKKRVMNQIKLLFCEQKIHS